MNKFYFYITLLVVASVSLFSSCDEDEVYPFVTLSQQSVYFATLYDSMTITYSGSNIAKLECDDDDLPDGWSVTIKQSSKSIIIYGPTTQADFENSLESTSVTFTATSSDGNSSYDYLTVGTTALYENISSQQANSFIVSSPNTIYAFDAMVKGENGESISTKSVEVIWQTSSQPISYTRLTDDGLVEFHLALDEDDVDADLQFDDIIEGSAVIAAYNSSDDIVWSWHIWITEFSAEDSAVELNGVTLMSRNLGAKNNSTLDNSSVLDSYGLYYQWGRKDPFVGPSTYSAVQGIDDTTYDESGTAVYFEYEESTSSVGKESYAIKYPMTYILGVEDSSYDWLYSAHSDDLWSETKTINDPCPKGWRVASPAAYEDLLVPTLTAEELTAISDDYGWLLTDKSGNSSLFMGLGRRGYITGKIQNVNLNVTRPAPWAGYYWTTSSSSDYLSQGMFFAYDQYELSGNQQYLYTYYRANGMQVRCQRDN